MKAFSDSGKLLQYYLDLFRRNNNYYILVLYIAFYRVQGLLAFIFSFAPIAFLAYKAYGILWQGTFAADHDGIESSFSFLCYISLFD